MKRIIFAMILMLFALAACDSLLTSETTDTSTTITQQEETNNREPETVAQADNSGAVGVVEEPIVIEVVEETVTEMQSVAYSAPAWANIELTNAITGESFTLADFEGKTVFIEPMAIWCSNCFSQQRRVAAAMAQLNTDDYVFISMSVEPIANDRLASYAQQNDFPQQFMVGTPELINALVEQFGRTIITPPSTPHFIISPNGTVSPLYFGSHREVDIIEQVQNAAGLAS